MNSSHAPASPVVGSTFNVGRWKFFVVLSAAALVLAAGVWFLLPETSAPVAAPAPEPAADVGPVTLRTNADAVEVFQRAFWREPAADDRILHAERREWVSETDGVRRWQWFLAVQPGPAFTAWLQNEKPFAVAPLAPERYKPRGTPPRWFPAKLADCQIQQAADSALTLIFDPKTGTLFATDIGHGFALSAKPAPAPAAVPSGDLPVHAPRR